MILILPIFILVLEIILIVYFFSSFLPIASRVPFIPSPADIYPKALKALNIKADSILYDLGCGDARFLIFAAEQNPSIRCVGFEKRLYPYFLGLWRIKRHGLENRITLVNKNFFKVDLSGATHLYTYLFPFVMDALLPKLERELRPGAVLLSVDFPFKNRVPREEVSMEKKRGLGKMLYAYEF